MDAIDRVRRIHQHAGVVGLFVDAIDDQVATLYARYGFEVFVDEPFKLFLPVL